MHQETLDPIDLQILLLLQARGRMKRNELAERVGLSLPAVSERMRKLEVRGIIEGYHAVVAHKPLGIDITAFVRVFVDGSRYYSGFVQRATALAEVLECHSITGEGSHLLKVRTRNTTTLERLLSTIQAWPGVRQTQTSIVLSTFKETRALPLEPSERHVELETPK
ncbi:MAG: Lrp/AsnC family transcriptional regulator [Bacteroidetes bacterium]|nr:Lrp/AsnC family transcriptional regulator [Rhodothermia bacterium]MCS7154632.1 Lrp/AsnC family transcriptional regulator [Bacteroidota bacterium]MCX7906349.1 Lrp/AsnC family transcriptional regulator [Bacteroidota bacterium]MDW8137425.1 Lrp/AsnC family transcriptional regulator [Bacteroidota bacterium]MDW8285621.1 Lrp/AsnC family transcriptional regulator [Bacteroidota bacterium]